MADALVSSILGQLATIISAEARQRVKLVTGVEKEINKLESNLKFIRTLLHDAEERQIKDENVQIWLAELKEVCYDMEDVLDEWNTALLKLKIDEADLESFSLSKGKVCRPFIPCFSFARQVVHRHDIALKIKEINERLDVIAKKKDDYQLVPTDIVFSMASRVRHVRRAESTSFTELSKLHGRDENKKELVSLLCGSSDEIESHIKTISVVGMGGVGKTALAQLIYNDHAIKTHFGWRIWVSVSEIFDEKRVAEEIIVALAEKSSGDDPSTPSFQQLLEKMSNSIKGKKVFLVLDDLWTEESKSWEQLNQAFKPAASGSRILVTTRNNTVAKTMNSFRVITLEQLNNNVCWKILSQEAFVGRDEEQCKGLEGIGMKIAERCGGLPLVAKTLGGMLRFKKTRYAWTNILNSEIWKLDVVQKEVFVPLLLSFYDLPSAVRRCFLYCSIFPKDFSIERDDLIYQWMAQGYLGSDENPEMEIRGAEYFDCLVERSFFQEPAKVWSAAFFQDIVKHLGGSIEAYKIHDVTVDFARFLMGNEFVSEDLHSDVKFSSEKTRHLLVRQMSVTSFPMHLGAEKLRSLTIFRINEEEEETSHQNLFNLFIEPKRVRSLKICLGNIGGLPKEVGKLLHLRLLNLSGSTGLERLPEAVCELCNLQSLCMQDCNRLQELPNKMEKLVNLWYLDTTGCLSLTCFPKGIGRLKSLGDLRGIKVGPKHRNEFSLGDLENLCHLRVLMIRIYGREIDANEARQAKLQSKKHLQYLELDIDDLADIDYFIEVLKPPSDASVRTKSTLTWEKERRRIAVEVSKQALQFIDGMASTH